MPVGPGFLSPPGLNMAARGPEQLAIDALTKKGLEVGWTHRCWSVGTVSALKLWHDSSRDRVQGSLQLQACATIADRSRREVAI